MAKQKERLGRDGKPMRYPKRSHRAVYDKRMIKAAYADRRTKAHKVLAANRAELILDLGREESLSYQQRSLATRAILLEARINLVEHRMLSGEGELEGSYSVLLNTLINLYKTLGIRREVRQVSLDAYSKQVNDDAN